MKEFLKIVLFIAMTVAFVAGMAYMAPALRLSVMRTFGAKIESAKTDIYRENKSYVEGTIRDLREMKLEYAKAEDAHRDALGSLILHRAGELDWERLPSDVRLFLESLTVLDGLKEEL